MSFDYLVASNKKNITPKKNIPLGCNGYLNDLFCKVDSDIEINALRLRNGNDDILIISVDTLFTIDNMKKWIIDELDDIVKLRYDQIFIAASHTHYAPFLDESKPELGIVNKEFLQFFKRQLLDLIRGLFSMCLVEAYMIFNSGQLDDVSISRRNNSWRLRKGVFPWKSMSIFPNKNVDIDKSCRCISFFKKGADIPLIVLWSFACHPVMYHSPKNCSSHFVGSIRTFIRKDIDCDIPVLFLQGFSGDIRPKNLLEPISITDKILAKINNNQYGFQSFSNKTYDVWINKMKTQMVDLWRNKLNKRKSKLISKLISFDSNRIFHNREKRELIFHYLQLSEDIILIGVSAEVVSYYSLKLQAMFKNKQIIPVGCLGTVFGYWPSRAMLSEGGYEVKGFLSPFSLEGTFKESVEDVFFEHINQLFY